MNLRKVKKTLKIKEKMIHLWKYWFYWDSEGKHNPKDLENAQPTLRHQLMIFTFGHNVLIFFESLKSF